MNTAGNTVRETAPRAAQTGNPWGRLLKGRWVVCWRTRWRTRGLAAVAAAGAVTAGAAVRVAAGAWLGDGAVRVAGAGPAPGGGVLDDVMVFAVRREPGEALVRPVCAKGVVWSRSQ